MRTVFITISRGSLIRNFFHTGIVSRLLDQGLRIIILTPYHKEVSLFAPYLNEHLIFEPLIKSKICFRRVFEELMKGAIFNKNILLLARYRLLLGVPPNPWLLIPRFLFIAPLRFVPRFKQFVRWLDFKINAQPEHDYLFKKHKPNLVLITSANGYTDSGVTKSAKRFNVPTIGMPKSWDNLSKILFNAKTDYLLVWNEFMREQAIRYQRFRPDRTQVTGVPQFDIYRKKDYLLSREEFCRQFNFDPNKKIILYGSSGGGSDIGMEADYPEMIQEWLKSGELRDLQVLIRPHLGYKDDINKFKRLEQYPAIVIDRTDKQNHSMRDHWDPSFNHLKHLYNSLHHADVCINIASTLTLDAIACNTPVINIKFDKNPKVHFNDSARRLHKTDYFSELMKKKATRIVESKKQFLDALKAVLERGERKNTQPVIDYFMYKNDGHSAERIVEAVIGINYE